MRRLIRWSVSLGVALSMNIGCSQSPEPSRQAPVRNVILLSIDTLRADRLGVYGYERPTTPVLDALAARGTRFERVYADSPWTLPSHMTMLTGRYPSAHAAVDPMRKARPEIPTLAETLREKGFRTFSYNGGGNLRWGVGFNRGFEIYDDADNEFPTVLEHARARLEEQGEDERLFLFLHTFGVHCPYHPPEENVLRFRTWKAGDEVPGMLQCGPWIKRWRERTGNNLRPEQMRYLSDMYDASVNTVDSQLATFVEFLDDRGIFEDTVLIITSDHGEALQDDVRVGHKAQMNIEVLRVPLIIVGANVPTGVVSSTAGLTDVVPTILDILDVEKKADVDGQSLVSLFSHTGGNRDGADPLRRAQFSETDYGKILRSIVKDSRHVIWDVVDGTRKYYDLTSDPMEQKPLPFDDKGRELKSLLEDHVEQLIEVRRASIAGKKTAASEPASHAELSEAEEERLRSLGYLQ